MVSLDHPIFVGLKIAGSRLFDLDHPVITLGSPHGSHLFIDFSVTLDVLEMHVYDCMHALIAVEQKKRRPRRFVSGHGWLPHSSWASGRPLPLPTSSSASAGRGKALRHRTHCLLRRTRLQLKGNRRLILGNCL